MSSSYPRPQNPPATVTVASANKWKDGINHYMAITPDDMSLACSVAGFPEYIEILEILNLKMYK